jgi:hypothetical protein
MPETLRLRRWSARRWSAREHERRINPPPDETGERLTPFEIVTIVISVVAIWRAEFLAEFQVQLTTRFLFLIQVEKRLVSNEFRPRRFGS